MLHFVVDTAKSKKPIPSNKNLLWKTRFNIEYCKNTDFSEVSIRDVRFQYSIEDMYNTDAIIREHSTYYVKIRVTIFINEYKKKGTNSFIFKKKNTFFIVFNFMTFLKQLPKPFFTNLIIHWLAFLFVIILQKNRQNNLTHIMLKSIAWRILCIKIFYVALILETNSFFFSYINETC